MPKVNAELFTVLNDPQAEAVLIKLYTAALKQWKGMILHFVPKLFQLLGKGVDWKTEKNIAYYDDKYIPIVPQQGTFLYMQARAVNAKNILEFGTSYGISTIYLGAAARANGGKVITTEYLPQKAKVARQNFKEAGLSHYIELWEGDALQTLQNLDAEIDFVLLDGWPDLVLPVLKTIESKLKKGCIILVDDVKEYRPSMQDYFDYVQNPANGYISTTVRPGKATEFTIKTF